MLDLRVVKRTGEVVEFDASRIRGAIEKAVEATGREIRDTELEGIVDTVTDEIRGRFLDFYPNVENIQDIVEKHLVRAQHYEIAKSYILYRAERQKAREEAAQRAIESAKLGKLTVKKRDGRLQLLNVRKIDDNLRRAARGLGDEIDFDSILREVIKNVYDEVETPNIDKAMVLAAAAFIERNPAHSQLAARLLLQRLQKEVVGRSIRDNQLGKVYRSTFVDKIRKLVAAGILDSRLGDMDLERLALALRPERDLSFQYLGLQTLYERYFLRSEGRVVEMPQMFWMRVAMGLAVDEQEQREDWAIEFYELMSQRRFVPSTPTLFHSGTDHPQLSSCYLTTIDDDLKHIFKSLGDNSQLSKWSGGIGNDWSNIRGTGAPIKSTKVESQGVIPFLKIANDVTNAINRSGKRRGATCAYLETWHYDIEDFLDLRKNTGDERRRTHDMNTANWIPDLFMKRVIRGERWTLFSPDEVPDLHHLYGRAFEERYTHYERLVDKGEMKLVRRVEAKALWRKMLTMLFETGHPWMTFKDACNVRSPQDHCGVIHSSNLCTEITLNTSADETAVCNLGSVNLAVHMKDGHLDHELLAATVETAIRMLDNVIDINFYPTPEARNSNLRHRPIGLGLMGFQDALFELDIPFESDEALDFADATQERISYHAILASSKLAEEREPYPSFEGSKWSRGILPIDTLDLLEQERGMPVEISRTQRLDWNALRTRVREHGMRNSNTMAVAPTATIANISGCFPCIEPIYKNIYVKANISGEFTIVNRYLVDDLRRLGMWNDETLEQLKYFDGNVSMIPDVPEPLKAKYKEAFDVDPIHALRMTATRGKWIDQSQSHNVFMRGTSGKLLAEIYTAAWRMGIKTTYYLRTLAATQIEKSTLDASKYGFTQKREYAAPLAAGANPANGANGNSGGALHAGAGNGAAQGNGSVASNGSREEGGSGNGVGSTESQMSP
ncbi:MAG: ribonucleoside-diphosphate reductase subunit alpha, partial [Holophagales bacterium]|nr:ribonucleoside-diphosphate reductase subunit alpha [Holophagales bacterium]